MFLDWPQAVRTASFLHDVPQGLSGQRQGVVSAALAQTQQSYGDRQDGDVLCVGCLGLTLSLQFSSAFPWMGPASWAAPLAPTSLQWSLFPSPQLALLSHGKKASWSPSSAYPQFNRLLHNLTISSLTSQVAFAMLRSSDLPSESRTRKSIADRKLHLLESYELIRRDRALKMN